MYRAKSLGQGEAVFYNPKMSRRGTRVAESGLCRALKRHEFALYFQPQYSVPDGRLLGVEALLRWQSPREGVIASADFIPAAEESGLIVDLGGWVIEAACAQIEQWQAQGIAPPRMAVNLSVQQLRDPAPGCLQQHRLRNQGSHAHGSGQPGINRRAGATGCGPGAG
jgi:EAL domain-containing protein (putative c-di-GMP-specific phosphodiesterase class I)